jgi:hypothetical protein
MPLKAGASIPLLYSDGINRLTHVPGTDPDRNARPDGFEPPTTAFEAQCSIQLSYGRNRREVYRVHYGGARKVANPARERSSVQLHVNGTVTTMGSERGSFGRACKEGSLR